jgi:hypothetical protein
MLACENFGRTSAPLYDRASGVRADRDVVAAAVIAAIDEHIADARCAHFAEGYFLRVSRHRCLPKRISGNELWTTCKVRKAV